MNIQTVIQNSAAQVTPETVVRNQIKMAAATQSRKVMLGHLITAGEILELKHAALGVGAFAVWVQHTGLLAEFGEKLSLACRAFKQNRPVQYAELYASR